MVSLRRLLERATASTESPCTNSAQVASRVSPGNRRAAPTHAALGAGTLSDLLARAHESHPVRQGPARSPKARRRCARRHPPA